jgi:Fe2+ or Zn2+ uptake regulation protein
MNTSDPAPFTLRRLLPNAPCGLGRASQRRAMTVPHLTPAVEAPTLAAAAHALRAKGLRVSSARRLVLQALFDARRPVSAEDIAGGLGGLLPRSDLASVYRNLETLEELGLVHHLHLGHGPGLYSPAGARAEFVVCERCGAFEAVSPQRLDAVRAAVRAAVGYEARFSHTPLAGLCPSCRAAGPVAGRPRHARP